MENVAKKMHAENDAKKRCRKSFKKSDFGWPLDSQGASLYRQNLAYLVETP